MYLWRHIWFLTEARYHLVRIMCLLKSYFLPFFQSHSVPICAYLGQVNCRLFRHKIFLIHMGSTGPGVAGGGGQEWPEGVGNKRVARANLKICQILPSSGWNYKKNRGKHSVLILFFYHDLMSLWQPFFERLLCRNLKYLALTIDLFKHLHYFYSLNLPSILRFSILWKIQKLKSMGFEFLIDVTS